MNKNIITFGPAKLVCTCCGGTGLYNAFIETGACAIICRNCKGTGCVETTLSFELFTGRKPLEGVTRVFAKSLGHRHYANDHEYEDGNVIEYSKGGCSYEEFLNGEKPKPVKDLYCPGEWVGGFNYSSKFYMEHCHPARNVTGSTNTCSNKKNKAQCWKIYEESQNQK